MKDLDFDELDRAVSSLMGGVAKDTPSVAASSTERIITIAPSAVAPETPAVTPMSDQPIPAVATAQPSADTPLRQSASQSPLVTKRPTGRFMDMVRSSPSTVTPVRPLPRQGVTIQPAPSNQVMTEAPRPQANVSSDPAPTPQNDWPDPIDMVQAEDAPVVSPTAPQEVEVHHLPDSEPLLADEAFGSMAGEDTGPLQTPFLTDPKVEKRPLGAFNDPTPAVSSDVTAATIATGTTPQEAAIDEDEDAQLAPDPADVPVELPAELQTDVMAIEGDETQMQAADAPEARVESPKPATAAIVERPVILGVTSIAQQYHTEPSTSETEHAGIYDTEAYTQPLQHPAKKKSGWLWVLWIVLLLALGSGGAAVLYYLDII